VIADAARVEQEHVRLVRRGDEKRFASGAGQCRDDARCAETIRICLDDGGAIDARREQCLQIFPVGGDLREIDGHESGCRRFGGLQLRSRRILAWI